MKHRPTTTRNPVSTVRYFIAVFILLTMGAQSAQAQGWRWVTQGAGSFTVATAAVADQSGSIYAMGHFYLSATFGDATVTGDDDLDVFLVKYTEDVKAEWARAVTGPGSVIGTGVAVDNDGNVYISGYFLGTATFAHHTITSGERQSSFVAKYTKDGDVLWVRQTTGPGTVLAGQLTVDYAGDVVMTGRHYGEAVLGSETLNGNGIFVVKYTGDGDVVWVRHSTEASSILPQDMVVDASGHVYIVGSYTGSNRFGNVQLPSAIRDDIFLVKYTASGDVMWARQAGGPLWDEGNSVAVDRSGNVYITGAFYGQASFSGNAVSSTGERDIFLARYGPDGNVHWVTRAGGQGADFGHGIALDASGTIVVAGTIGGNATFGEHQLSTGSRAIFVAGFDDMGQAQWARDVLSYDGYIASVDAIPTGDLVMSGNIQTSTQFGHITLTPSSNTNAFVGRFRVLNNDPVASDDRAYGWAGSTLFIDVLANDVDPDGDSLTLVSVAPPASGTLSIEDGRVRYDSEVPGTFEFAYTITDGRGGSAEAVVTLIIRSAKSNRDPLVWDWARMAGGTHVDGPKLGHAVAVDVSGNAYVTGQFRGSITFGNITLESSNYDQFFVAKYSPRGEFIWVRHAPGTESSEGLGIAVDAEANVYVTGRFRGSASFGNMTLTSRGADDVFTAKYSPEGDAVWARRGGSIHNDTGNAVAVDHEGNVYVTGDFQGEADFGSATFGAAGNTVYVVKYSPDGHVIWGRWGGHRAGVSTGNGIAVDHAGGAYVTGWFRNNLSFWPAEIDTGGGSDKNIFLLKLSPFGNGEWVLSIGSESDYDYGYGLATDANGNAYITGTFGGSVDFGGAVLTASSLGGTFVAKYNPTGSLTWVRHFLSSSTNNALGGNRGHAIAVDPFEGVYVTGDFSGNITIGNTTFTSQGIIGHAGTDAFVVKYDTEGEVIWAGTAAGPGSAFPRGIAADASGRVYVAGSVWNEPTIFGNTTLSPVGANVFVARLSPITGTTIEHLPHGGTAFSVAPPYPNPARDRVTLPFILAHAGQVHVEVYDILGRHVFGSAEETLFSGKHEITLDTSALASGVYLIRLRARDTHGSAVITIAR